MPQTDTEHLSTHSNTSIAMNSTSLYMNSHPLDKELAFLGLYPYQRQWLLDTTPIKIGMWARQTGKDFTCAAEAVLDCLCHPGVTWLIVACSERQALESFAKATEWAQALQLRIEQCLENKIAPEALLTSAEIRFANGSRLLALPSKPATLRGYSANLILTEFAFHDDPDTIWQAIFPSISNPLRGGSKKLRIISTPNGLANRFHDLWHRSSFTRQKVTIHDAVALGLPLDIPRLRQSIADPDAWAQEYECEFIDSSSVLLPYELIQRCESDRASEHSSPLALSALPGELYLGIDFGRKHDLTVCWTLERLGHELWTREVLTLDRLSTPEQIEILRPRLARARLACIDYTGAGVGLGDYLVKSFGEFRPGLGGRIELCHFSSALKNELFPRLRAAFEKDEIRIPISRAVREDLHNIHRVLTPSGTVTYRANHSTDGHGDRSTALALALRAATLIPAASRPELLPRPRYASLVPNRRHPTNFM